MTIVLLGLISLITASAVTYGIGRSHVSHKRLVEIYRLDRSFRFMNLFLTIMLASIFFIVFFIVSQLIFCS